MLMPKRVKYRKQFRGRMRGKAKGATSLQNGEFGMQALEPGWITSRQIETVRRVVVRHMKRRGKVWIRIFPDKPYTKRAQETRMGKGKGNVEYWVAPVQPGRVLYEIQGVSEEAAREAFRLASAKLAVKTTFVSRSVM